MIAVAIAILLVTILGLMFYGAMIWPPLGGIIFLIVVCAAVAGLVRMTHK